MGIKNNDFILGTAVYFTPASDSDDYSGLSVANSVTSPDAAIDIVNNFDTPPTQFAPASIVAVQGGITTSGVTLPDNTSADCGLWAIVTTDAVGVELGNAEFSSWGAVVGVGDNTVNTLIDGKDRVVSIDNTCTVGSDGSTASRDGTAYASTTGNTGVKVTGECESIFVERRSVPLMGSGAIGFEHTAETSNPAIYKIDSIEFNNINQTAFKFAPIAVSTQQVEVEITTARLSDSAVLPTTGSLVYDSGDGVLVGKGGSLEAETIFIARDEGIFIADHPVFIGDGLVEDGGTARLGVINSWFGDFEIEAGGVAHGVIHTHVGALTFDGDFHGIINGVRYGNWRIGSDDLCGMLTSQNTGQVLVSKNTGKVLVTGELK